MRLRHRGTVGPYDGGPRDKDESMAGHAHRIDAIREWLVMTAPVGVYLWAEHQALTVHPSSIAGSAEWGIATGFLCLATVQVLLFDTGKLDTEQWALNRSAAATITIAMFLLGYLAIMVSMSILDSRNEPSNAATPQVAALVRQQWWYFASASSVYLWVKMRVGYCVEKRP